MVKSNVELAFLFSLGRVTNKVWFYTSIGRAAVNLMTLLRKICYASMFKGALKYWVQYSYILLHEDCCFDVALHHDIGLFCAKLAEDNMNDVVSLITYIQINSYVYIYMHGFDNHIFSNTYRFRRTT